MENMETIKCYCDGTKKKCEADAIRIILHVGTIFIVIYNLLFVWFIDVYLQLYRRGSNRKKLFRYHKNLRD